MLSTQWILYKVYLKQRFAPMLDHLSAFLVHLATWVMALLGASLWVSWIGVAVWHHFHPNFEVSHFLRLGWCGLLIPHLIAVIIDTWIIFKREFGEDFNTDRLPNGLYILLGLGLLPAMAILAMVIVLFAIIFTFVEFLGNLIEKLSMQIKDRASAFKKFKENNPELVKSIEIEQARKHLDKKLKASPQQPGARARL